MKSNIFSAGIRIAVSFCAIALITFVMRHKIEDAWDVLQADVRWSWVWGGFAFYLMANAVLAWRLKFTFKMQKIELHYFDSLYLAFLGLFFNLFLPSAIGGDVAKAYYAAKFTGKKVESMSAVFQDRLIGFAAIMMIAFVALLLVGKEFGDSGIKTIVYTFIGLMIFVLLFFLHENVAKMFSFAKFLIPTKSMREKFGDLYKAINRLWHQPVLLLGTLFFSFLAQTMLIIIYYLIAIALHVDISFIILFLVIPVVAIASMLPSVGGLGVREMGVIFLLKHYMEDERALVLSLLLDMIIYGTSLAAGVVYAFRGGLRSRWLKEMEVRES